MRISVTVASVGLVVAVAVPLGALASHGKVGLWEITSHVNMPNMSANIPPEALARMKAMGMAMPDNQTFTSQHCMTAEEVASEKAPTPRNSSDCMMSNVGHDAHNFTADMTCNTERVQGQGHVAVNFDSDAHYTGTYTFNGTAQGHPQNMTYNFEGRWIGADCGGVK